MLLFLLSFIAGILTVLAPCILPLLPVIVGGSVTEGKVNYRKAFIVAGSLGLSVILFTILLKISTAFIDIPQEVWRWVSGGIIIAFGVSMLLPNLFTASLSFSSLLNRKSNELLARGYKKQSVWGDVLIGAALGPVFATCSPTYFLILATVLPQSFVLALVYMLAYALGLCLMLLLVSLVGQKILTRVGVAADPSGWFKRTLGAIFIIVGIVVFTGYDKKLEVKLLDAGLFDVTRIEQKLLEFNEKNSSESSTGEITAPKIMPNWTGMSAVMLMPEQKAMIYKKAIEISTPDGFVNTNGKPVTIGEFAGKKVVLLDIWTYSCINCQRTLPYLNAWYEKYRDQGLEIIGLHTPEFSFEEKLANVEEAAKRLGVKYPVVLDNDYSTWNAYGNSYWPRKYLIDIDGYVVYDHIGEGGYEETERAIQLALEERAARIGEQSRIPKGTTVPINAVTVGQMDVASPEVYFGAMRNQYLGNGAAGKQGVQNFTEPQTQNISPNTLYLVGNWNIQDEYAENSSTNTKIIFKYRAKNVYMVASSEAEAEIEVFVDGKSTGKVSIKADQLYDMVKGTTSGEHTLEIRVMKGTLKAFTFTFG